MKKLLHLVLILVIFSTPSCIDNDYDLSKIDTDDLTIGGEGSKFQIPLATVNVSMKEINSKDLNIQDIFDEANTWLPTELPTINGATVDYVDIVKLNDADPVYTSTLLNNLIEQMKTDDTKCDAVAKRIFKTPEYKKTFERYLPSGLNTETAFVGAFRTAFRINTAIQDEAKKHAGTYLTLQLHVSFQPYTIKDVNIDSDIVDMLTKNLDKPGNSLKIYGEVESKLPISLTLTSPNFSPTDIRFGDIHVAADATSVINRATVTEKDLRQLVNNVEISLPVVLERYYRNKGFKPSEGNQIILRLRLEKEGGLDLKL